MLFYATGATWAALAADLTLGKLHKRGPRSAIWVPLIFYTLFITALLITVEFVPDQWVTRVLCFLIGASLMTCLIGSLQTSLGWLEAKRLPANQSFRATFGTMLLIIAFFLTPFFSWLADRMYYTNRNVTYWVRVDIGVTVLFLLVSALI